MKCGSSTSGWKPRRCVRLDLIFTLNYIYISCNLNLFKKFTSRSRSTGFKNILPWNISQMIKSTTPINMRIVKNNVIQWDILFWAEWKVNKNWNNHMIRISQWKENIAEQILASEERNNSKRAELWESQTGMQVGKLTIWIRSSAIENCNRVH